MASQAEADALDRAVQAAVAVGRTLPNPQVGCVLLAPDGTEVAVGVHRGAGAPHAEVDALASAGERARGATAVVTLEPCDHTGRTGPCSQALIEAGVARVVYGTADPNPTGAGGAKTLVAAGIDVECLDDASAAALIRAWSYPFVHGRPFVTWKYASTLDGLSAAPDGSSKWITGEPARRDVQRFRAECDAIMAGTYSVLADDPRLTLRDEDDLPLPYEQQPLRVVVGESLIPRYYRIFDRVAPTRLIQSRDPHEVLTTLAEADIHHVWLEGGPRLAGAFWSAGLIDRVIGYMAPAMLGSGRAALEGEATTLADMRPIDLSEVTMVGRDIRIIGTPGPMPREGMNESVE